MIVLIHLISLLRIFPLKNYRLGNFNCVYLRTSKNYCRANNFRNLGKNELLFYNTSFCTLFRPTFTDQGICYAFNAKQPHMILKPSSYLDAFSKVFGKVHSFGEEFEPFNITGMGPNNGLTLYLDAHNLTGQYKTGKSQKRSFLLNFDHFNIFPLISQGGVTVSAGQKTSIVITPRVLESTEDVKSLSPEKRKCKFSNEAGKSNMFSVYSHSGCIFKCLWKQAADDCKCYPWKYPMQGNVSDICDLNGNLCFKNILAQSTRVLNCSCDSDCSKISYDLYIVRESLNPSEECSNYEENKNLINYLTHYQRDMHMTDFLNTINFVTGKLSVEEMKEQENPVNPIDSAVISKRTKRK